MPRARSEHSNKSRVEVEVVMRQRSGRKKNSGFSLLEVVVAITIIAILSIPIIRAFATSAGVNKKARRVQNATDVAQSVSEYLCKASFTDLAKLTANGNPAGIASTNGDIVINGLDDWRTTDTSGVFHGASGEKFTVDVTMKSRSDASITVQKVKDYQLQELKDLFGNNSVSCVINNDGAPSGATMKTTTINITVNKVTDSFDYRYELEEKYSGSGDYVVSRTIDSGTVAAGSPIPAVYVSYDVFNVSALSDQIYINYTTNCGSFDGCPMMKLYFIQQKQVDTGTAVKLTDANFHIAKSTGDGSEAPFACINNIVSDGAITEDGSKKVRIYDITVTVKLKTDVITTVSTVREEIEE